MREIKKIKWKERMRWENHREREDREILREKVGEGEWKRERQGEREWIRVTVS